MGAWSAEPFGNDDAADWRYLLVDGGGPEVVAEALRRGRGDTRADQPTAAQAVAAAAVVARAHGVVIEVPDDVEAWLERQDGAALRAMVDGAVAALDRVLLDSELAELWDEAEGEWAAVTRRLRDAVAQRAGSG